MDNVRVEGLASGLPLPLPGPTVSTVRRQSPVSNGKEKAVDVEGLLKADPVTSLDLTAALQSTKPSSDGNMIKYDRLFDSLQFVSIPHHFRLNMKN